MADMFHLPRRFLTGDETPLKLAEFVFSQAAQGRPVSFSMRQLVDSTGLSRRTLGDDLAELERRGILEDVRPVSERLTRYNSEEGVEMPLRGPTYRYEIPGYDKLVNGGVEKPLGYVANGWLAVIGGRLTLRLLNIVYDHTALSHLDVQRIRKTVLRNPSGFAPRKEHVNEALGVLVRIGLVTQLNARTAFEPLYRANSAALDNPPIIP